MNPALAFRKVYGLARFARNLRGFLSETVTLDQACRRIEDGVRNREERFLHKLQLSIYSHSRSPYLRLLNAAGCTLGDIREMVAADGLEGALEKLAQAGVYLRYEELKGREPAVRGSRTFHFEPSEFDDPNHKVETVGSSGGTRGAPVANYGSFAYLAQMVPHWAVFFAENECMDKPLAFWTPGHSGASSRHLWCAKFGKKYEHWFISEEMTAPKDRFYSAVKRWLVAREGKFPPPEAASYDRPEIVLDRMLALLARGGASLNTAPSAAVKLSLAAQARGASLAGLTFLLGAEPLTRARKAAIEASGARATPLYGASEATWIGGQCSRAEHPDEVHVLLDNYALVAADEADEDGCRTLRLTTLQPLTQKVLLNVDIGDRAALDRRRCDCLYDRLGCTTVLHTIRSSDKITEYGVNIAVADVFRVLEETLPRRFGGVAGDYQLVESRDDNGLPRYRLLIDPRVPGRDEEAFRSVFLTELAAMRSYYGYMAEIFRKEKILSVERRAPLPTGRGKVLAFHRQRP